jgi:glutathione synthase/RimK-type ligase-like ATP-grasp enzyme
MKDFSMRLYSLDVWYTKNGIKIFELNSSPAIYTHELGAERFHKELYTQIKNKILNIK